MAQARLWLWGLVPLVALWLLGVRFETRRVEADLSAVARATAASANRMPARLTARGRDIIVGGAAYDPADRAALIQSLEQVPGVRRVVSRVRLVPVAKPYAWSATTDGGTLALAGAVPNPKAKVAIIDGANGATIQDSTVFARGAPDGFPAAAGFGLTQLAGLAKGRVAIDDKVVSISGMAKDGAARDKVVAALSGLPAGFTLGAHEITAPSYDFSAHSDPGAGTLTLGGSVPDEAAHAQIVDAARKAFAGAKIVDEVKVHGGAPDGFAAAALAGLEQLSRLDKGQLAMSDTSLSLTGGALFPKAEGQIKTALAALPKGFSGKSDVRAEPPAAAIDAAGCQSLFGDLLGKGKIQFETASAKIDGVSGGLLDHLVGIALRCPSQTIEISGHTDGSGNPQSNLDLSKRRAQAVVDYLAEAGLDRGHLTAIGYGATKPIAPNDTPDGMAKNRRIEFVVR